jgi:hypothetical protein
MTNKWWVNLLVADFIFPCFLIDLISSLSGLQLLPPPNVTGNLHLGHALTAAIQVGWHSFLSSPFPPSFFFPLINHGLSITPFLDKPWFFLSRIQWSAGRECLDLMPYGCLVLTMLGLRHRLHHLLLFKFSVCFSRYPYLCIHLLGIWTASCSYYTWNIHMLHPICLVFA